MQNTSLPEGYKLAEKILRHVKNFSELEIARKLLPPDFRLIVESDISKPFEVLPNVTLHRGMLNSEEQIKLAKHIVTGCVDYPHSNNLSDSTNESMWDDYQAVCTNSIRDLHTCRLRRLRWSCKGFHYDWTNRSYCKDNQSDFPPDDPIQLLYKKISDKVAESVIANFYHSHRPGDRLGGHRDDCEPSLSPLLLVSLGIPAVLLLGDDCGVLLRSGDAIVMKDQGRLTIHGVPCVFTGSTSDPDGSVEDFLERTRISLSVRCVW